MKQKVLFICVHKSARSQMAAAWLNDLCGDYFEAQSAGLERGHLNPLVVQVMDEVGIDISNNKPQARVRCLQKRAILSLRDYGL